MRIVGAIEFTSIFGIMPTDGVAIPRMTDACTKKIDVVEHPGVRRRRLAYYRATSLRPSSRIRLCRLFFRKRHAVGQRRLLNEFLLVFALGTFAVGPLFFVLFTLTLSVGISFCSDKRLLPAGETR
jgi:hypothetical protein